MPTERWVVLITVCCLGAPAVAATAETQPLETIRAAAAEHALATANAPAGADIEATAAALDSRLRLRRCARELETFSAPGAPRGRRIAVGIRCPDAAGWSLYVPVELAVHAEVVVLNRTVRRGAVLAAEDLRLERRDVGHSGQGHLRDPGEALGRVARRVLTAGQVLEPGLLEAARLIRRGERVAVLAGAGGFRVHSEGEALTDAAAGERLRVRNPTSRQVIEGTVDADGRVVVR